MMTSAAPTKFRFDLDLGHRQERNTVLTETAIATLLDNACEEDRREGLAEGERGAAVRAAQAIAEADLVLGIGVRAGTGPAQELLKSAGDRALLLNRSPSAPSAPAADNFIFYI